MSDHSIEIQARAVRIILCDILDCAVRLNRLSSPEIARATHVEYRPDGHQNTIQLHNHHLLAAHQIDHNYSLQPHHVNEFYKFMSFTSEKKKFFLRSDFS